MKNGLCHFERSEKSAEGKRSFARTSNEKKTPSADASPALKAGSVLTSKKRYDSFQYDGRALLPCNK